MSRYLRIAFVASVLAASFGALSTPALAHVGIGEVHTFTAGVMHPLTGLDHILAAFAVGLWAALSGSKYRLLLPVTFVATMAVAAAIGAEGWQMPYVEPAIGATVVALGLLIALLVKAPALFGVVLVALFAFVHGHVHGAEGGAAPAYLIGLVTATAALHLAGFGFGALTQAINRPGLARVTGGAIALAGVWILVA